MLTDRSAFLDELRSLLGERAVLTDDVDVRRYVADWRGNFTGRALAVALPATTQQVSDVVRLCAARGVAIVAQGGNTGLVGASVPDASGTELLLSLARMNRIRDVDVLCDTMTVEAGCVLQHVQEEAARHRRLFPLSLAAEGTATIGGNLSTNAGGVQVLRYGNMRDLTLGLEAVLPDGRVWNGLSPLRKDNTGYDLKQLFIGAEGTLGVVTAATLKLFPQPAHECTAWLAVPDPGAAVAVLARLRERLGDRISAFELIGREVLALVPKHFSDQRDPFSGAARWVVLTDAFETSAGVDLQATFHDALGALVDDGLADDVAVAASSQHAHAWWKLRESIPEAQTREGPSIKHDISVPVSRIAEFIERTGSALQQGLPGIRVMCFGHVGDGNLHYNQSPPPGMAPELFTQQADRIHGIVHAMTAALGGSISAEHGIGRLKQDAFLQYKDPLALELMQRIKRALDPDALMNPGRLLPLSGVSGQAEKGNR